MKKVLVLGGYGAFGRLIVEFLVKSGFNIIINGRNKTLANNLKNKLDNKYNLNNKNKKLIETAIFDIEKSFNSEIKKLKPFIVINTCGPFQLRNYDIPKECIKNKIHYIDLADGLEYVKNFHILNNSAKKAGVILITGASTVPGLSSAVIKHVMPKFKQIKSLVYGIAPGQKSPRGIATTKSILSYLGKPLVQTNSQGKPRRGWQNIYLQKYPEIGKRWMGSCDIPDIVLFPKLYKIKNLHFCAGMENSCLHLSIWILSWLTRLKIPLPLMRFASSLLKMSHIFDIFGSDNGGMHMIFKGIDKSGKNKTFKWFIVAKGGDGPQIPALPAAYLAKQILKGGLSQLQPGAYPCVNLISLKSYLNELSEFNIKAYEKFSD